ADGTIYTGSYDKKLYAINPDGTLKWTYTTGGSIYGSPAIGADGTIYVGSYTDKKLNAINPDGTLKWSYTTTGTIFGSPSVAADGTIYIGTYSTYTMFAISSAGTLKWSYKTGNQLRSASTIGADGTVYFSSSDGNVYALSSTGTLIWKYNVGSKYSIPIISSDGVLYVGSNNAAFYAFKDVLPAANFISNATTGNNTLTVKFTDSSLHSVSSWAWDFNGDGVIDSTLQNPTWTYTSPGVYTVVLTVTNAMGNNTLTKTGYITVYDTIPPTVTANVTSGAYNTPQEVGVTASENATIYYALNGGTTTKYTGPITITNSATLAYFAMDTAGNWSPIYTQTYVIDTVAPTVTANVTGGAFKKAQTVVLTSDDPTVTIYYTTDGSDPTVSSTVYNGAITVANTTTLKYVAVDAAGNWSPIYTENYTIDTVAPTVTANVTSGVFNGAQTVSLTSDDVNSTIYYTTDGTDPSRLYTGPITVSKTTTLKYLAVDGVGNQSPVYTQSYVIDTVAPTVTVADPVNGAVNVAVNKV
ncbi:MAG: chitobiase/beta-hexosaminidase C-terminal domain-containing protein, partial [Methanobacterium paludis]|nr:chitobiase/beta-hexosaminidase C-terminal domain-containing protein [Methanobacterium paludis]